MAVLIRKTNSTSHPGEILLRNKQTQHPRQQIEADEAHAAALARTTEEEVAANRSAVLEHIAQLEDSMEQKDATRRMHSIRPDLVQPR